MRWGQGYLGSLDVPLCGLQGLSAVYSITATDAATKQAIALSEPPAGPAPRTWGNRPSRWAGNPTPRRSSEHCPSRPQAGDQSQRSQIGTMDTSHTTVPGYAELDVNWVAILSPTDAASPLLSPKANLDESPVNALYPLPLNLPTGRSWTVNLAAPAARLTALNTPLVGVTASGVTPLVVVTPLVSVTVSGAAPIMPLAPPAPQGVTQRQARPRETVTARLRGQTLAQPPAGVAVIAPPASPTRCGDLFGVGLRVTPPHTAAPNPPAQPATAATSAAPTPTSSALPAGSAAATSGSAPPRSRRRP